MSGLYWTPEDAELKTYSSSSKKTAKGLETIIKIEICVRDTFAIGSILRQLDEVSREQDTAKAPPPKPSKSKAKLLALPAPALQLEYFGDDK